MGQKVSIENDALGSGARKQGIGSALMEHVIVNMSGEQVPVDLNLTFRPERVVENECIGRGERMKTNEYRMTVTNE